MRFLSLLVCSLAVVAPPTSEPTTQKNPVLDSIEKELLAVVPRFKSVTATLTLKVDFSGKLSWDRTDGKGTVEYLIQGDKILSRVDVTTDSISTIGSNETKTRDVHTLYGDGQFVFDVGETNGQKLAFKMKSDPMQVAVPSKAFFDVLRKDYEIKVLPDEKIDGKAVWVIEARPRDTEKTPAARMVSYIRKDIPLTIKTVSYSKFDKIFQTTTLTDIKVNPKIDPERFVFKHAPDFEYYDVSKEE
jgi:outer membrane lipoprotein-sorting protein